MNELLLIIILLVLTAGLTAIFWVLWGKKEPLSSLHDRIAEMNQTLGTNLSDIQKLSREITQGLTRVDKGQEQAIEVTKQLENILKNPKQRGGLGEYLLDLNLKNIFGVTQYQMQYKFTDKTVVDAVIFVKDQKIPIDAKFSFENYKRLIDAKDETERKKFEDLVKQDLKNRIDETSKYIKPSEGTTEFAFMFIPSETLYYDLLTNKIGSRDLIEYAMNKKVTIVSPTSFQAYLQTVLQGLKMLHIEEKASEIIKRVRELSQHLSNYNDYFEKLRIHLGTTVNMYNNASKEFGKIDKDVLKISGEEMGIESETIEGPVSEE